MTVIRIIFIVITTTIVASRHGARRSVCTERRSTNMLRGFSLICMIRRRHSVWFLEYSHYSRFLYSPVSISVLVYISEWQMTCSTARGISQDALINPSSVCLCVQSSDYIGVGARRGHVPHKIRVKYFSDKYHVKFGHFDNFSYIIFGQNVLPPKLTELLTSYYPKFC